MERLYVFYGDAPCPFPNFVIGDRNFKQATAVLLKPEQCIADLLANCQVV
ncbi:hypothetical protein H6G81_05200 [Scytonema hofmannii FACHB-248]|uniref:Uncharacterized protein n=1 Tax=Scytonema hofmannii FACHB-248 TaxID=1842502 RepID=A0ABR8GKM5_9CYAN|nr:MULTISPECIES: hypothetical protein [Nostocales]MBD2603942.1 hypothetical protein [Scytonema hofmannii FACHB-248]